jgi:putative phosphoesterase
VQAVKIGLISDIHGNYAALKTVIRELKAAGADAVLNAGDNVGYSSGHEECIKLLVDESVSGCMGNYDEAVAFDRPVCGCGESDDKALIKMRAASLKWARENASPEANKFLSLLPRKLELNPGNISILAVHGGLDVINDMIGENDDAKMGEMASKTNADVIVMGHTHIPFSRKAGGKLFVNPGSVGRPVDGDPRASYAILTVSNGLNIELRRTVYDVESNISDLVSAGLPAEIGAALRCGREI